jgi:Uma2 family endonuclease
MSRERFLAPGLGPFRADNLRPKDPYELSRGHAIRLSPTGGQGSNLQGGAYAILSSDPKVVRVGVDPGFKLDEASLRAPDIAILPENPPPGWVPGAPMLAIEYAGPGQDEAELQQKIQDFLAAGTEYLWIVRLVGPRRVEVYAKGRFSVAVDGDTLSAPEYLANPVPVRALFDDEEARALQLVNLLQRHGYRSLDDALGQARSAGREEGRDEGRQEGREEARRAAREGLLAAVSARGWALDDVARARVDAADQVALVRWLVRAVSASDLEDLFGG